MRVVLDTDVVVAGVRSDSGLSRRLLVSALNRRFALLLSTPLMLEYESVLMRADHLTAAGVTAGEVTELLDALSIVGALVYLDFRWRPMLPDPNDDMVIETAVNGSADLLVTFNTRDFAVARKNFGVRVVSTLDAAVVLGVQNAQK